jgi:hypothetical protein
MVQGSRCTGVAACGARQPRRQQCQRSTWCRGGGALVRALLLRCADAPAPPRRTRATATQCCPPCATRGCLWRRRPTAPALWGSLFSRQSSDAPVSPPPHRHDAAATERRVGHRGAGVQRPRDGRGREASDPGACRAGACAAARAAARSAARAAASPRTHAACGAASALLRPVRAARRGAAQRSAHARRPRGFGALLTRCARPPRAPRSRRQARRGVPVDALRLSFAGAALPDDLCLARAGVHAHATLRVALRTRGAPPAPRARRAAAPSKRAALQPARTTARRAPRPCARMPSPTEALPVGPCAAAPADCARHVSAKAAP